MKIPIPPQVLSFASATLALLGAGFLTGCKEKLNLPPQDLPSIYVAYATGQVDVAGGPVELRSPVHGTIKTIYVKLGDEVHVGQSLADIDNQQEKLEVAASSAALDQARAQLAPLSVRLEAAQRNAARLAPLVRDETAAQAEFDKANDIIAETKAELEVVRAGVAAAEVRVRRSEYAVEQCTLKATVDGVIVRQSARQGNSAQPEITPLFTIAPYGPRLVRAYFDEDAAERLSLGMTAEIVVTGETDRVLPARVIMLGAISGLKPLRGDTEDRADQRGVECFLSLEDSSLRLGRQVLVRIKR